MNARIKAVVHPKIIQPLIASKVAISRRVNTVPTSMDLRSMSLRQPKKYRCKSYTPCGRRGTGLRQKDDGGGVNISTSRSPGDGIDISERISLHDLYTPRAGTHRSIAGKDDGGGG
jgi:hypothetical protein